MYVGGKIMRKNVCVLTDFSVQSDTGKYTLARIFQRNKIEKLNRQIDEHHTEKERKKEEK
jgi:hypothetical protein